MLNFDDERWNHLTGGYRTPFDPRPLLHKLANGEGNAAAWHELWGELHIKGMLEMLRMLRSRTLSRFIERAELFTGIHTRL